LSLLQPPPVPHEPLLLHPFGMPGVVLSLPVEQLVQDIVFVFMETSKNEFLELPLFSSQLKN
jgi:hypothetical protein